jgi:hypothetical protein
MGSVSVKRGKFSGRVSINSCLCHTLPKIIGAVRVKLWAPFDDIGGDPDCLAGVKIGCLIEECHDNQRKRKRGKKLRQKTLEQKI